MSSSIKITSLASAAAADVPAKLHYSEAIEQLLASPKLMSVPLQHIALPHSPNAMQAAAAAGADKSDTDVPVVKVPKVVREYPLPGARETHEMAVVGNNVLAVTQQVNSTLVKVQLCPVSGRPVACARFVVGDFWDGLHGLAASHVYPGRVWASLQFKSLLILINPGHDFASAPTVEQVIELPSSVYGPHCVCECDQDLWTSCKDSSHVVRINLTKPHAFSVYPCSRRPIFIAMHPTSKDVYASLDLSSKIWRLVPSTGHTVEIDIPSSHGSTPVGLIYGPDGNVWFTLLGGSSGGSGAFARISAAGELQFFQLTTPIGAKAGLIHLAFDWDHHFKHQQEVIENDCRSPTHIHRLWLLSSSLVAIERNGIDAVFTVLIDSKLGRIITQHSISLPTQHCANHRILPHRTGLFVSQLSISSLAHITGAAAMEPEDEVGETTDMYNDFGLGQGSSLYVFSNERVSRSKLLSPAFSALPTTTSTHQEVLDLIPAPTTRVGKRPRPHSDASDM